MNDQANEVRTGEELDVLILNSILAKNIEGFSAISAIKQFPGGYSNLTYLIETPEKNYVLRKPPKGAKDIKGGHNMKREFDILSSLFASGFRKIPTPLFYSENEDSIGSEFYVMEKLEGTILRNAELKNQKSFLTESLMRNLSSEICQTQAALHKIPIENTPLNEMGKPEGYIKRQVNGWNERYLNSQTDENELVSKVFNWLSDNLPDEIKPTLLHNDFKYDNVIFDLEKTEILAILDWEMATIGDPRMDIGTTLSYWAEASDGDFEKNFNLSWLPGNLTRNEYVKEYQSLNPEIDLSNILYFYVFGLFKNAVIIQQIYSRYKKGLTQDPRFAHLIVGVKKLIEKASNSIEIKEMV